ncbi:MAG: hypothetical protein IT392_09530 [Nitrospirae bacterium]|nr:hypothetical protein [Nitrospirota bacterium]
MEELLQAFKHLKQSLPDYEERPQQIKMAGQVFACLQDKKRFLIEAGTGVGKSFAYLIPAILSQEKTIVSTVSIALQEQLVKKDLVFLHENLPYDFTFALLKGKNNYLCLKREKEYADTGEAYKKFKKWCDSTRSGDKDELHFIPDFWGSVSADPDDCSGKLCPWYEECFYYRHYRQLHNADILVVNHHLLVYDLLSEFNLLPFHSRLIIDEAHQMENVLSAVMGSTISFSRISWILHRLRGLKIYVDELFGPVESFFRGSASFQGNRNSSAQCIFPVPDTVIEGLRNLHGMLSLDTAVMRLESYKRTAATTMSEQPGNPNIELFNIASPELTDRIETTINYVKAVSKDIRDFIEQCDTDKVYYLTWNKGYLEFRSDMVEVMRPFEVLTKGYDGVVMTSATLSVMNSFDFLKERLGITDFEENVIESPFDYQKQALLYVDKELPPPAKENSEIFNQKSVAVIERLINSSRGRALVLFTSYNHLRLVSKNINTEYPCKSQGDMPPSKLIKWFKETDNPVLLATTTFWQGIDIRGEQLSLVVIIKLPFRSPGDPVYEERCRRLGERWFSHLALPSAILLLRQGVGRLIRGTSDRGVVAILDSRLVRNSYGKMIISSLPAMDIVHSAEDVERFFKDIP